MPKWVSAVKHFGAAGICAP